MHVGIIMDANGRWASARGQPRRAGHRAGADAVRRVVEAAPALRVDVLTLYAFSADNWRRPALEVRTLMRLLEIFLRREAAACRERGVRVEVTGRRDRLSPSLRAAVVAAETATADGAALRLRLAVDHSSRDAILAAAAGGPCDREEFARRLEPATDRPVPALDLVIRTGGEQRLSDFMLWESAYAELYFCTTPWPDFDGPALAAAMAEFARRQRRFGGLPAPGADPAGLLRCGPSR